MWGIGATAVMVAALLAPPSTVPELPDPLPAPREGCVLPLLSPLGPCPPGDRDGPPGGCILPVGEPLGDALRDPLLLAPEPACPDPGRSPLLEVLPLSR